jgi:hypothetical protein
MSSETSSIPQSDETEVKMRRTLGLDAPSNPASVPSSPGDPLRGARQAIRFQAAAREYVERQLAHAEATIEDLRTKQHHGRQEKGAALEAARLATALKITAQRTLIATEAALAEEKVARDHGDRALREAQATINHLQVKLDAATQGLETVKTELTAERQVRQKAQDALREAIAAQKVATLANRNETTISAISRRIGRPEKTVSEQPVQAPIVSPGKSQESPKIVTKTADKPKQNGRHSGADEQEPIQWWVKGWNGRRT